MTNIWTREQDAQLRVLWDEGHSVIQIGKRIGVSNNAVTNRVKRIGLTPRPSPIKRAGGGLSPIKPAIERIDARGKPAMTLPARLPPSAHYVPPAIVPARDCQWNEGDGRPWRFCGEPVRNIGCPYCARHAARAFQSTRYGEHSNYLAASAPMRMTVPAPISDEVADQGGA